MIEFDIESSINSSLSSAQSAPCAMDGELLNSFSKIKNIDPNIRDWRFLSILNGRDEFIVVNDTKGLKCWSLQSYYKVMSIENQLILDGKGLIGVVGSPNTIQLTGLSGLNVFCITFKAVGCIPVLKRIEIKNNLKKRIGIIAENSKILSFASFRICNEQEGVIFNVKPKINFWKGFIYDIREASRGGLSKVVATVERKGPAHVLRVTKDVENIISCSNKALFISLCIFLDVKRRQFY